MRRRQLKTTEQKKENTSVPEEKTPKSTALAVRERPRPLAPYAIPTPDEFAALRSMMAAVAATEFVPQGLRGKPDAALAAVLYGRELGFPPMTSLKYIQVIQGQPTVAPRAMAAMIRRAGHVLKVTPPTPTQSVIHGKRRDTGEELTVTWTIEDARRAGLVRDGSGWTKFPADMLFARAMGTIGRRLFEDVVLGSYAPQEFAEGENQVVEGEFEEVEEVSESTQKPAETTIPAVTQPTSPPKTPPASTTVAATAPAATPPPASPGTTPAAATPITLSTTPETNLEPAEIGNGIEPLRTEALKLAANSQRIAAEAKYPGQSFTQHQLESVGRRSIEKWLARENRAAKTLTEATEQDLKDVITAIQKTLQSAAA
jgi:hypothetical protein